MSQFFNMKIGQSELDEQSSLIGGMLGILRSGRNVIIVPDKTSLSALAGLENLLDEIAVQMDEPEHPDQPDPFKMGRSELSDYYYQETGDTLTEAFGCGCCWPLEDGREFVADALNS